MWPFRRHAFTSDQAGVDALHDLAGALKRLREDHEALCAAHTRLRGRFYALKGVDDESKPKSKAEILREFGVVPGHPVQHK